jgi:cytochrome b6-f complex iron-sulfur subunit
MDIKVNSRRNILELLMGIGTIATLVGAITPVLAYLSPLSKQSSSGNILEDRDGSPVSAEKLQEGVGLVGRIGDRPVLAIRKNDQILGYSAVCTHLGCIVRWNAGGNQIECPCHGGRFNLLGEVTGGPPPDGIPTIHLKIEDNRIVRG